MASRIIAPQSKIVQYGLIVLFGGGLLSLLIVKHYEISWTELVSAAETAQTAAIITASRADLVELCGDNEQLIVLSASNYICEEDVGDSVYADIFTSYPTSGGGREFIYGFIDRGDKAQADEMLAGVYHLDRYEEATIPEPIDWQSDPFGERYWRFLFYSLRPLRHVLAAGKETGNDEYYEYAARTIGSFATEGIESPYAWDDPHGAAFRTMVLVHAWWTLREAGELDAELSSQILQLLTQHGEYLLEEENYEADNNHAITQGAALLLLAQNFPDLSGADVWRSTATERLESSLSQVIDEDGVLAENSPYYHFYVLEKYWEIYAYTQAQEISISDDFDQTIEDMIDFATYVLRPDLTVPLLGASIPRQLTHSTFYQDITATNDQFSYVLTEGTAGEVPEVTDQWYPSSGLAIWRSGWGENRPFKEETQVHFDTGPYRTDHSDFDALTFSLFGMGTPVIQDAGLYTYESQNQFYEYFHGTRGHNTVIVDGEDQREGSGSAGQQLSEDGVVVLETKHELYEGVTHLRTLVFLKPSTVVVLDGLYGRKQHTYEQLFHFPIGTVLDDESNRLLDGYVPVEGGSEVHFQLEQLLPVGAIDSWEGAEDPIHGWCSLAYEERAVCPEVSFRNQATSTQFITVINLSGEPAPNQSTFTRETGQLSIETPRGETFDLTIMFPETAIDSSSFISVRLDNLQTVEAEGVWQKIRSSLQDLF